MAEMPSPESSSLAQAIVGTAVAAPSGSRDLIPGNPAVTAEAALNSLTTPPPGAVPAVPDNAYVKFYGNEPSKKEVKARSPRQQLARAAWVTPLILLAVMMPALPASVRHPMIVLA